MSEYPQPDQTVAESPADPLEAGLAAAFGPDSGPPLPAGGSVLQALAALLDLARAAENYTCTASPRRCRQHA